MIRNNLSIFNSKFVIIFRRAMSVFIIVCLFYGIVNVLNYMYFQEEDWQHILWHSFYSQEDNIDNIFIGSSHVYCGVNPFLLDEINGMNNFNLSSGSLTLSASYAMLKEADRLNDLSNVYLELYYAPNTGINGDANTLSTITNNWRTTNYLKPSFNKYSFIFSMSGSEHYLESLFPFVRYRFNLFDVSHIQSVITRKESEDWNNYKYFVSNSTGDIEYLEKGFCSSTISMVRKPEGYLYASQFDLSSESLVSDKNCDYLKKIIKYCDNHDIKLQFFVAPIYETQILSTQNYDAYYKQISEIANSYNIPFYDFNLCKAEYLDIMHPELFSDNGHLNTAGANIFTSFLWEVLSNSYENNKQYFCDSYNEKISLDSPQVYGVYYVKDTDGEKYYIASNTENELEYKIAVVSAESENKTSDLSDAEEFVVQDFSLNKMFLLPNGVEHGTIVIVTRNISNSAEKLQTFEIPY